MISARHFARVGKLALSSSKLFKLDPAASTPVPSQNPQPPSRTLTIRKPLLPFDRERDVFARCSSVQAENIRTDSFAAGLIPIPGAGHGQRFPSRPEG
ncbi:MAG: hypothetical protein M4579_005523 [Chaenotheca gracillima]|nr:MAG: hypothetical protein M4579_005523 [Chaenotheca gracillima]